MVDGKNILVIEDNETYSLLTTHYLKNNVPNGNIFIENSAKRAIESLPQLNPTVIVLDYYLEEQLSARDVLVAIKKLPKKPHVILLSSIEDKHEQEAIMKLGVDQFIPKSNASMYDLLKTILEVLERQDDGVTDRSQNAGGKLKWLWVVVGLLLIAAMGMVFLIQTD